LLGGFETPLFVFSLLNVFFFYPQKSRFFTVEKVCKKKNFFCGFPKPGGFGKMFWKTRGGFGVVWVVFGFPPPPNLFFFTTTFFVFQKKQRWLSQGFERGNFLLTPPPPPLPVFGPSWDPQGCRGHGFWGGLLPAFFLNCFFFFSPKNPLGKPWLGCGCFFVLGNKHQKSPCFFRGRKNPFSPLQTNHVGQMFFSPPVFIFFFGGLAGSGFFSNQQRGSLFFFPLG